MPRRKAFSNREKLHILDRIDGLLEGDGEPSFRACCREVSTIQPCQVRRWQMLRDELANPGTLNRCSLHSGRPSILAPLEDALLRWFFELREQGFMVSVRLKTLRACKLSALFRRKTVRAKDLAV